MNCFGYSAVLHSRTFNQGIINIIKYNKNKLYQCYLQFIFITNLRKYVPGPISNPNQTMTEPVYCFSKIESVPKNLGQG